MPYFAILVIDVSGSTRFFHDMGDISAHRIVQDIVLESAKKIEECGGRVVKHLGDGFFALLPNVLAALSACRLAQETTANCEHGLGLRIGIHAGDVLEERADAFGDAVNVAFRVAERSSAGQITAISDLTNSLPHEMQAAVRLLGAVILHGKPGTHKLYDLAPALDLLS